MTQHLPVTTVPALQQPIDTAPAVTGSHGGLAVPGSLHTGAGVTVIPPLQQPPNAGSSAAAFQGGQGSPALYSAGGLLASSQIIYDRQDVASARAERMEQALEQFMLRSSDQMQRSDETTRAMFEQMRYDQQASERRTEALTDKLTADAITAAAANASSSMYIPLRLQTVWIRICSYTRYPSHNIRCAA